MKAPTALTPHGEGEVDTAVRLNAMVTTAEAVNPLPVTVTVVPTNPLAGVRDAVGSTMKV